ncbi:MAG: 3-isopropylmalate dehydrogenase [Gammaproteobacteria bacterium]|nr:3-isopropylmalate dehydrogenase [Gammaproteobacteria bacterium]MDH3768880.1 3-isopropylmalate dehydrogenase [Gammaproteobacteria bacterium]
MRAVIAVLPGDGVGAEVTTEAVRVLEAIAAAYGHEFEFREALIGGAAIDAGADPLPEATLELCRQSDAVLLGAVGGPKWSDPEADVRPEQGLLAMRKELGLFANLRPVVPHPELCTASPIKAELLRNVDIIVVRELTGGIYFGDKTQTNTTASDLCSYTTDEIERVVRVACRLAQKRRGRLTSVDKANVLATGRLWRITVDRVVREEFPDLSLEHLLVDAAAMHLLSRPADFDVIVTENMFGDILTDEASMLAGSMGLLPSASLGADGPGVYEPIHGSAPDIAGKGIANPYAAILSTAMLLRHSLNLNDEAVAVETAVAEAIDTGARTPDLCADSASAMSTRDVGTAVVSRIEHTRHALRA